MRLVGTAVTVTEDIDLMPHTIVRKGEKGCVVHVSTSQGISEVWVFLDEYHKGLSEWDNCFWLELGDREAWNSVRLGELVQVA